MALEPTTVKEILDKATYQYHQLELAIDTINNNEPDYFPLITQDDDYLFEKKMIPAIEETDDWNIGDAVKASPLKYLIGTLNNYFATNENMSDVGYGGALDAYLWDNELTVLKHYADAQYYISGYKMAGLLVDNTEDFIFAEFGIDEYDVFYFDSLGSYQTDDINAPYGIYDSYTSFAPTDQVEIEIVSGTINFDIHLICKDKDGESFVFEQNISGVAGDKVKLNLEEKITGCSGLETDYTGTAGDLMRIQAIASEV